MPTAPEEMTLKVIAHIHTAFPTKFGCEFVRSVLVEAPLGFRLAQAGIQIDAKRLRDGLCIGERRIDLRLRCDILRLFEISRTGLAELGGLIFLAINHDDLLGSAAE